MFGEKTEEYSAKRSESIPVWKSPKYEQARKKAIEIIDSKQYDLAEGDFWILMNETKSGKIQYSGLIISHNGCLKINDKIDEKLKFKASCVTVERDGYKNSLVFTYINDEQGIYEVGEVSGTNCKNEYPYAMALKRCMDRVILKNCKLAYDGVYSDSEAEEFKEPEKDIKITSEQASVLMSLLKDKFSDADISKSLSKYGAKKVEDLTELQYGEILHKIKGV